MAAMRIFISYKRRDFALVQKYIREIEKETGASCWYDLDGIETSEQFGSVICQAIDTADVFLFMHSSSHVGIDFQNDWTIRELNYAQARKKRVVLVKMDDAPLENLFLLLFGANNNIQITDPLQKAKLFKDLRNWMQLPPSAVAAASRPSSPRRSVRRGYVYGIAAAVVSIAALLLLLPQGKKTASDTPPAVEVSRATGTISGHEYVDLGLSVKWARVNIGAAIPEQYGQYFAWGETTEKEHYDVSNVRYCTEVVDSSGHPHVWLLKYNSREDYGPVDGRMKLEREDDAAAQNWGGTWRMPTREELEELRCECVWERVTLDDVVGDRITGPSGNSIFLPAAGFRDSSKLKEVTNIGFMWSSSVNEANPDNVYYFYSGEKEGQKVTYASRRFGTTVRAVTE